MVRKIESGEQTGQVVASPTYAKSTETTTKDFQKEKESTILLGKEKYSPWTSHYKESMKARKQLRADRQKNHSSNTQGKDVLKMKPEMANAWSPKYQGQQTLWARSPPTEVATWPTPSHFYWPPWTRQRHGICSQMQAV